MDIYAAIILGVFFLAGIVLHHWLRSGRTLNIKKWNLKGIQSVALHWFLLAASSIGYTVFTIALLTSRGDDKETGVLFLLNVAALIIGATLVAIRKMTLSKVYGVAVLIQSVILVIMLIKGYGDAWLVAAINASIIVGFCLLAWLDIAGQRNNA